MSGIVSLSKIIKPLSDRFNELNVSNSVSWEQECSFAIQQLSRSPKLMSAAMNDPLGVKSSVLNVAAIGISLNPALQHAYLVPRAGKICLDISFRGLIYIATDSGSIKWAKSDLVYSKDVFEWNGISERPTHKADIFGDRGDVVGGYCLARLTDDSFIVDAMRLSEIKKAQAKSKAQSGDTPWGNWWEEMAKKTIIKRAAKTWPQMANGRRLEKAIHSLNEHEGITIDEEKKVPENSGVAALEGLMSDSEKEEKVTEKNSEKPNIKDEEVVLDVTDYDLILDEIESACSDKDLLLCADKISNNKVFSEEEKGKLRMAFKKKQKELKNGRDN